MNPSINICQYCPYKAVPISSGQWATPCTVHQSSKGQQRQTGQPRAHSLNLDSNESCFRGRWRTQRESTHAQANSIQKHPRPQVALRTFLLQGTSDWGEQTSQTDQHVQTVIRARNFFYFYFWKGKDLQKSEEIRLLMPEGGWKVVEVAQTAHSSLSLFRFQGIWLCGAAGR